VKCRPALVVGYMMTSLRFQVVSALCNFEAVPCVGGFHGRLPHMEQPEVMGCEIRRVRWLGDDRNVFLGEKLLHKKRSVARCVIVMLKPLSLPFVAPLPPNCIAQSLQNFCPGGTNSWCTKRSMSKNFGKCLLLLVVE
jgi:hypothetical protein